MSSNKPLPSSDLDVFKENSIILDNFVNSQENEHPDRFNRKRPTITGIIKEAFNVRTDISNMNETLIGQSRWDAVPKNTSLSLGGDNGALNKQAQALFNRTVMLKVHAREALRRTYLEAGLNLVEGSFEQGGTLNTVTDILLEEKTGKVYNWSGSFPKVISKGTLPSSEIEFVGNTNELLSNKLSKPTGTELVGSGIRTLKERLNVVIYMGDHVASTQINHTELLQTLINGNKIIDLEGLTLTVDKLTIPSNRIFRNGKIRFTNVLTSSIEQPLVTGYNYIRGINSETNYPVNKLENITFENIIFENIEESTSRKFMVLFMNATGIIFNKCIFNNIFGRAITCLGDHYNTTPNITAYDIPIPRTYVSDIVIKDCKFYDGFFRDGQNKLQLGSAIHLVACKDFSIENCFTKNCIAGYLIDFLNYGGKIKDCSYKITRPEIYEQIANYTDVVDLYFGQATQRVTVTNHTSNGASRCGVFIEAASFIDISNSNFEAWPAATNDHGYVAAPNKLYPNAPDLVCQDNKLKGCSFKGFDTPCMLGSTYLVGIDKADISNCNFVKRSASPQPAIVLNRVINLNYTSCFSFGSLFINGVDHSQLSNNYHKVSTGNALIIKNRGGNWCSCSNNTFISDNGKCVNSETYTGFLRFIGGTLRGSNGILEGDFTSNLEFINYNDDTRTDHVLTNIPVNIPANSSVSFYKTINGVKRGDIVATDLLSETHPEIAVSGWVNNDNTVQIFFRNVSNIPVSFNTNLRVTITKFCSADFRK